MNKRLLLGLAPASLLILPLVVTSCAFDTPIPPTSYWSFSNYEDAFEHFHKVATAHLKQDVSKEYNYAFMDREIQILVSELPLGMALVPGPKRYYGGYKYNLMRYICDEQTVNYKITPEKGETPLYGTIKLKPFTEKYWVRGN